MAVQPDYAQSLEFLRRWSPDGPWVLTSINPKNKAQITTRTFSAEDVPKLTSWLEQHGEDRNVYFTVNPVKRPMSNKPMREDIASMAWLHVDIDPREREELDEEQDRILSLLKEPPGDLPPPTCVVFSGGGYQGFWRLEDPFQIDGQEALYEEATLWNKQLELLFTADSCHNVDRIMRLPGTINRPDAKKRKKGRREALARLVDWADHTYPLEKFRKAPEVQGASQGFAGHSVKISGDVQRIVHLDKELPEGVPDRCKTIIAQGLDPDEPDKFGESRSEWLFYVCCELVRCGVDDDTIFSIITDPDWGVSKSVLDKRGQSEKYAIRQIEKARERAVDPMLMELNAKHALIGSVGGKCRIISEERDEALDRSRIAFQSAADFKLRYCNRRVVVDGPSGKPTYVPLGSWWLGHALRRQYETLIFSPGRDVPGCYNLWRGFAFEPREGDCSLYLEHVRDNVCGGEEEYFDYVMNWMAIAVQKPAQPGHTSIVLRGRMGTGKGVFIKHFGKLFGRHFLQVGDPKHLVGSFNAHLRDCVVLFADEAFYAGDKKHESILKMLVTEETLTIEGKGLDVEAGANYVHLMMASNSQWVVPAGFDERRFFVLDVGTANIQDKPYFRAIEEQLKNGGYEALLYHLMTRDLSEFEARNMPRTAALQEQKIYSFSAEQEWWYTKLCAGEVIEGQGWPQEHVFAIQLTTDFTTYAKQWGSNTRSNATRLGQFMKDVCPTNHILRGQISGKHDVVIDGSVRTVIRPKVYRIPDLEVARAHWDENFGGPYDWNDPVEIKRTSEEDVF